MPELTLRGLLLGALITVIFTAANVYLGLKVGLTFASSIPAAVISMAALRPFRGNNILENNLVQTQASAAGTLSSIIFVLPGLIMIGHWTGFPYWTSAGLCMAGGALGVLFTIPLRRAMVVEGHLPFPEGLAAAEILRVGDRDGADASPGEPKAREIAAGGIIAAVVGFATGGLHLLSDGISTWFAAGHAAIRLSTGFSLALLGAGYLIGLSGGLAMLLGAVLSWGVAVPVLTLLHPMAAGQSLAAQAMALWVGKVRFIGVGMIGIAAIWSLVELAGPTIRGVRQSLGRVQFEGWNRPRTDQDISGRWVAAIFAAATLVLILVFWAFMAGDPVFKGFGIPGLLAICVVFAIVFGALVAAACGYMAGLVGSSSSPISGIGILATLSASVLLLLLFRASPGFAHGRQDIIGMVLFTVSAILATATISNDNLQDLKTGYLVQATPWRQQVALLVGVVAGALVIPPILDLLYKAYGFVGALPRPGMDAAQALAAPQATLMTQIATGILGGSLAWSFIYIGAAASVALILIDKVLGRMGSPVRLPPIAVGIGLYLPPSIGVTLAIGAIMGWVINRRLRGRADAAEARRRGVLIASGLIVGDSLIGVVMAAIIAATGSPAPLAIVGDGFAGTANLLGLVVFLAVILWFSQRAVKKTRSEFTRDSAAGWSRSRSDGLIRSGEDARKNKRLERFP